MSIPLIINGITFDYPETDDEDWGPDATDWAAAVTSGMLQKAGGLFTLTSELDLGSSFGLKSLYYKSRTANTASAGQIQLAKTDTVSWRNNANSGNLDLAIDSLDRLTYNGIVIGASIAGNVVGPASATANAIVLFDSTTGKLIKDGGIGTTNQVLVGGTTPGFGSVPVAALPIATDSSYGAIKTYIPSEALSLTTITNANAICTESDGFSKFLYSTGNTNRTWTTPPVAVSASRRLTIKKIDAGTGTVTITLADGTCDGFTSRVLTSRYDEITIYSDASNWFIESFKIAPLFLTNSVTAATSGVGLALSSGLLLTPGVWLVSANGIVAANSGTAQNFTQNNILNISTTSGSGTGSTIGYDSAYVAGSLTNSEIFLGAAMASLSITDFLITVATTTTYYLNGIAGYSGNAPTWYSSFKAKMMG